MVAWQSGRWPEVLIGIVNTITIVCAEECSVAGKGSKWKQVVWGNRLRQKRLLETVKIVETFIKFWYVHGMFMSMYSVVLSLGIDWAVAVQDFYSSLEF